MGITVGAKTHYSKIGGVTTENWFGTTTWVVDGVTYDARQSCRITITTDEYGANQISVGNLRRTEDYQKASRLNVTDDPTSYNRANGSVDDGVPVDEATGTATINVKLSPNSTYYVWLFATGWSDRFTDSGIVVTSSGTYGTAGEPEAANGEFGKEIPISIKNASSGASFTVTTSLAGRTETLQTNSTSIGLTWTPSIETYAPLIKTASSGTATISVETFYSGVSIGTNTKQITVSFGANTISPTVSSGWVTASPLNESPVNTFTCYVQGYSKARAAFTASKITCQYGATIAGYRVSYGGTSDTTSTYDTVKLQDTPSIITCTVIDSRGQETSETISLPVQAYSEPGIDNNSIVLKRRDSSGADSDSGTNLYVSTKIVYSRLSGQNTCTLKISYKKKTDTAWSSVTLSSGGTITNLSDITSTVTYSRTLTGIAANATYDVRLEATDKVGKTISRDFTVLSQQWAMKFRPTGNGVAFGKAAEYDSTLELGEGWNLALHDNSGNTVTLSYAQLVALLNLELPKTIAVSLTASGWSSKAQTVSNTNFKASGYTYIVSPLGSQETDYTDAQIYADPVSTAGQMTFHCENVPTNNITVIVLGVKTA